MKEYLYYIFEPKNDTDITDALTPIKTELADTGSSAIKVSNIITLMEILERNDTIPSCILFSQNGLNQIRENGFELSLLHQSNLTLILLNSKDPNYISITPANWNVITLLAQGTVSKIYCDMSEIRISFPNRNTSILVNNKYANNKTNNANGFKNKSNRKNRKEKQTKPEIQVALPKANTVSESKNTATTDNSNAKNVQVDTNKQSVQKTNTNKQKVTSQNNNITDKSNSKHEETKAADTKPSISATVHDNKPVAASTSSNEHLDKGVQKDFSNSKTSDTSTPEQVHQTEADTVTKPQTITFGNDTITTQKQNTDVIANTQKDTVQDNKPQATTIPAEEQTEDSGEDQQDDQSFLAQAIHTNPKPKPKPKSDNQDTENDGNSLDTLNDAIGKMKF